MNVLDPAGPVAAHAARLSWALFGGGALVLAAVALLTVLALRGRLARVTPRVLIVAGGLVVPTLVLGALLAVTLRSLPGPVAADALVVSVAGRMWWWEVRYPDPRTAGASEIVLANELRIPVGREVHLRLATHDVIHSFWVPQLAGKVDMVPGRVNGLVLRADRPGVFRGPCAEFCGTQHARMALHVVALPAAEFDAWLANQALPAREPTTALQVRGRQAFVDLQCIACHRVRGVADAPVGVGPDLTHVASRLHLGAGTLANGPGAIADWVAQVQRHKPGASMPGYERLDAATLQALDAWLGHLR